MNTCQFYEAEPASLAQNASQTLQRLLDEHKAVRVPRLSSPLMLDRPLVLDSGMSLCVDPATVIRMEKGCGGCMARNRHIVSGCQGDVASDDWDSDITIEGGIWDESERAPIVNDSDPVMRDLSTKNMILGVLFFSHAERITVRHVVIRHGNEYGVLLAGCRHFHVDDVFFDDHFKDGVHVNGPAEDGLIENMRGTCGDDFVALNAWDWDSSALSFGAIRRIEVRHIACDHDEMRLLPGRKTYPDGRRTDCPIEDCLFFDISGAYNFKLYQQPNCHNHWRAVKDFSDIPGLISRVAFKNIRLDNVNADGLAEVHLDGMFEIGADCRGLSFEHITLGGSVDDFARVGMTLVSVGPKSSTWTRGSLDPAEWAELFEPDLICTADGLLFKDIRFAGLPCSDASQLILARRLTPNADYPRTKPRGGTGYGIVKNVRVTL